MSQNPAHNPARDYPEACRRIEDMMSAEPAGLNPVSRTIFLTHGQRTTKSIVLLHGYTSSPWMYRLLAKSLFDQGLNVLVPRAPRHGLADRSGKLLAGLSQAELLSWAGEAIDQAHGLGYHVGLAGLSMGGTMALWAARFRHDLDFVAVISPALAYTQLPLPLTGLFGRVLAMLPNHFSWWDDELKQDGFPFDHGYPRYASRGLAAFTILGNRVWRRSRHHPPAARKVLFIINPSEKALNNDRALEIQRRWESMPSHRSQLFLLDRDLDLPHDYIDPGQPRHKLEITNPLLTSLLSEGW